MLSVHLRVVSTLLHSSTSASRISTRMLPAMRPRALHATRMQFADDDPAFNYFDQRPPSEKQVQYAQRLAQQLAKPLPEAALQDFDQCSQFIDECLSQAPPSQKQLQFAQQISQDAGIDLPSHSTVSAKAVSDYINDNQHLLKGMQRNFEGGMFIDLLGTPSDKQVLYAASLARQRNIGLSAEALSSKGAMSQFIDACLNTPEGEEEVAASQALYEKDVPF